jgi:hypothetical protein
MAVGDSRDLVCFDTLRITILNKIQLDIVLDLFHELVAIAAKAVFRDAHEGCWGGRDLLSVHHGTMSSG